VLVVILKLLNDALNQEIEEFCNHSEVQVISTFSRLEGRSNHSRDVAYVTVSYGDKTKLVPVSKNGAYIGYKGYLEVDVPNRRIILK
jgi:hypothetical protein